MADGGEAADRCGDAGAWGFGVGGGAAARRERGTPQGGVISPLLANLFLHYAFDAWMRREMPGVPFERYTGYAASQKCRKGIEEIFGWLKTVACWRKSRF